MILAASTLLPALLGFAGRRIDALGLPNRHHEEVDPTTAASGDASPTQCPARPWLSLIGRRAVLLLLALPFLSIQFGMPDDGSHADLAVPAPGV